MLLNRVINADKLNEEELRELDSMIVDMAIKDSGIKFNLTAHKKLWNWLSENPGKLKREYFEECDVDYVYLGCYACDFSCKIKHYIEDNYGDEIRVYVDSRNVGNCIACPHNCVYDEECLNGAWDAWVGSLDRGKEALNSKYAREIRDFPLRTDIEIPTE